ICLAPSAPGVFNRHFDLGPLLDLSHLLPVVVGELRRPIGKRRRGRSRFFRVRIGLLRGGKGAGERQERDGERKLGRGPHSETHFSGEKWEAMDGAGGELKITASYAAM